MGNPDGLGALRSRDRVERDEAEGIGAAAAEVTQPGGDEPVGVVAALSATLLFIVPQQRATTVWNELKLRCGQAELEWQDGPGTRSVTWSRVGRKTLLITSWTHVLEGLLDAAHSGEHDSIRYDILQLRGLTSRMDSEAFLPIRADEVTDQGTAHRLINYSGLIEDITRKLRDSGLADTRGLRPTHGWHTPGRYLRAPRASARQSYSGRNSPRTKAMTAIAAIASVPLASKESQPLEPSGSGKRALIMNMACRLRLATSVSELHRYEAASA